MTLAMNSFIYFLKIINLNVLYIDICSKNKSYSTRRRRHRSLTAQSICVTVYISAFIQFVKVSYLFTSFLSGKFTAANVSCYSLLAKVETRDEPVSGKIFSLIILKQILYLFLNPEMTSIS